MRYKARRDRADRARVQRRAPARPLRHVRLPRHARADDRRRPDRSPRRSPSCTPSPRSPTPCPTTSARGAASCRTTRAAPASRRLAPLQWNFAGSRASTRPRPGRPRSRRPRRRAGRDRRRDRHGRRLREPAGIPGARTDLRVPRCRLQAQATSCSGYDCVDNDRAPGRRGGPRHARHRARSPRRPTTASASPASPTA